MWIAGRNPCRTPPRPSRRRVPPVRSRPRARSSAVPRCPASGPVRSSGTVLSARGWSTRAGVGVRSTREWCPRRWTRAWVAATVDLRRGFGTVDPAWCSTRWSRSARSRRRRLGSGRGVGRNGRLDRVGVDRSCGHIPEMWPDQGHDNPEQCTDHREPTGPSLVSCSLTPLARPLPALDRRPDARHDTRSRFGSAHGNRLRARFHRFGRDLIERCANVRLVAAEAAGRTLAGCGDRGAPVGPELRRPRDGGRPRVAARCRHGGRDPCGVAGTPRARVPGSADDATTTSNGSRSRSGRSARTRSSRRSPGREHIIAIRRAARRDVAAVRRELAHRLELPGAPACRNVPLRDHDPTSRRRHAVRQPARRARRDAGRAARANGRPVRRSTPPAAATRRAGCMASRSSGWTEHGHPAVGGCPATQLHPIIREHPETGRPGVFGCIGYIIGVDGLPEDESHALLFDLTSGRPATSSCTATSGNRECS